MKSLALVAALLSSVAFSPLAAAQQRTLQFNMTVSTGASSCLPNASATVTDHTFGIFENLKVVVHNLPPNTGFDFFIIQIPIAPFGASWYMGDINTDSTGTGVGNFVGRFSSETFIISPGFTPAPMNFPTRLPRSRRQLAASKPIRCRCTTLDFGSTRRPPPQRLDARAPNPLQRGAQCRHSGPQHSNFPQSQRSFDRP